MLNLFRLVVVFSVFIFGVTFGHYKYPPFSLLKSVKDYFYEDGYRKIDERFEICNLPELKTVPEGAHAFIGHAYGAPREGNEKDYLASNVLKFIQKNKTKLKSVSFTGDVFAIPSLEKWKRLGKELTEPQKIFIAPGNHDVARLDSLDVFGISSFGRDYPFLERLDHTQVVYEDSIASDWLVSSETLGLVNSLASRNVIVARHNIPVVELKHLANSTAGMSSKLPGINEFVEKFRADVSYTWLIGDSGAFPQLPRISCFQYSNHTFIANGVGGIIGDSVVIFIGDKFYRYEL